MDADFADYLALLSNTSAQDKFLLPSQEKTAGDIDRYVTTDKTEFLFF